MKLNKLVHESLSDQILKQLVDGISSGLFKPGTRLREGDLSTKLGVSRGPLREALKRLEAQHIVERIPNQGVRIISPTTEDIRHYSEIRGSLEGLACRLVAERSSEQDWDRLANILDMISKAKDKKTKKSEDVSDLDFHVALMEISGNPLIQNIAVNQIYFVLRIYEIKMGAHLKAHKHEIETHHRLLDAIRARDGDKAELLMRLHIQDSTDKLLALL